VASGFRWGPRRLVGVHLKGFRAPELAQHLLALAVERCAPPRLGLGIGSGVPFRARVMPFFGVMDFI